MNENDKYSFLAKLASNNQGQPQQSAAPAYGGVLGKGAPQASTAFSPAGAGQSDFASMLSNLFGGDGGGGNTPDVGGFNFDKLGQGIGIGKDILQTLMGIKAFGNAQDLQDHQIGLDKTNLFNASENAQAQFNNLNETRRLESGREFQTPEFRNSIEP